MLKDDVETVVREQITALLEEVSEGPLPAVESTSSLRDLHLDSLVLARLVIELEEELGVEPFGDDEASIADIRTVADLVKVCVDALDRQGARA